MATGSLAESVVRAPFTEIGATLEVLAARGITPEHLRVIRSVPDFADEMAQLLQRGLQDEAGVVSVEEAMELLSGQVISFERSKSLFKFSETYPEVGSGQRISYKRRTLKKCALQNKQGSANWWLLWINSPKGVSLLEKSTRFRFHCNEWARFTHRQYVASRGYYLINFASSCLPEDPIDFQCWGCWNIQGAAMTQRKDRRHFCDAVVFLEAQLLLLLNDPSSQRFLNVKQYVAKFNHQHDPAFLFKLDYRETGDSPIVVVQECNAHEMADFIIPAFKEFDAV